MSFSSFGLSPELLRAVADQGYEIPTPVQLAAIPLVLAGRDLLAGAQTGTGKTAAFVLPIIHRLHETRRDGPGRQPIRCLVVVPTRELALQVEESVRTYGARRPVRSATIYGGVGFGPQVNKLRAGPEVVVATPGRLLDHVSQRTIDLSHVEVLVLDEADRMLDMGFIRDIRRILALLPARRQNLLFSATSSDEIRDLASGLLTNPAFVQVTPRNTTAELVDQLVIPVDRERKRDLVRELVALGRVRQALVFTRTKHGANRLALQLVKDGLRAAAIHGNKSQSQRVKALDDFKAGRVDLLVATDIAARGLDIEQLPHVLNFELPMVPEDYIHRIGRTGRAGETGQAISLVCVDEAPLLRGIQGLLGRQLPSEVIAGFEPDGRVRAEPIRLRSTPAERRDLAAERATRPGGRAVRPASAGSAGDGVALGARGSNDGRGVATGRPGSTSPAPRRHEGAAREESGVAFGRPGGRGRPGRGRGRGREAASAPGTGFGNAAPAGRPQGDAGRRDGATPARASRPGGHGQPRPRGDDRSQAPAGHAGPGASHGRPGSGIAGGRPQGQGRPQGASGGPGHAPGRRPHVQREGHGGAPVGSPRALPGERLHRLG